MGKYDIVIDAKSGTTGAGRGAKVEQLFAEVNENFRPYAFDGHRHHPEIDQELRAAGASVATVFIPHLLPLSRGMLSTMYVRVGSAPALDRIFEDAYRDEPFVVLRHGEPPTIREVRGTNRCAIGWRYDRATGYAVIVSALDNLGKGAAGQGVQCMNVVLGVPETMGLDPDISLAELAEAAPDPWGAVLTDHRLTLISATTEISALAESNRDLLDSSYRALQEALGLLSSVPEPSTYTADGATSPATTRRLFDQST